MQQQISESRERHGELVQRIDQIHQTMLTKDDLKMLFEVIKAGGSK
jgi:DNA-binding HxlR family transcriptional regulator